MQPTKKKLKSTKSQPTNNKKVEINQKSTNQQKKVTQKVKQQKSTHRQNLSPKPKDQRTCAGSKPSLAPARRSRPPASPHGKAWPALLFGGDMRWRHLFFCFPPPVFFCFFMLIASLPATWQLATVVEDLEDPFPLGGTDCQVPWYAPWKKGTTCPVVESFRNQGKLKTYLEPQTTKKKGMEFPNSSNP